MIVGVDVLPEVMNTIYLPSGEMCGNQLLNSSSVTCSCSAVRLHPPDLHRAAAGRVEVDVAAVGRILRAVVQTLEVGEVDSWPLPSDAIE